MRRLLYLLPMVLFLVLALYFAASLRPGYDPHVLPSAMLDKPAPAFSLAGLSNRELSRRALEGKPAVINFFASWCVPCRIEHPVLMRLAHDDHVPIYGIAYKDKPEDAGRLLAQFGDPYEVTGMDLDGQVGLDFGVYGVPETYVLDKTGTIRMRFVGPLTEEIVESQLLPLLKTLNGA
jgi:cytochrome c biogenesis protein CcmG/thiol:disulfide interchange protein DsbE